MTNQERLSGKVVIVTGGASGIGEAAVRLFAENGARVVAGDLNGDQVQRVSDSVRAEGHDCIAVTCDVTSSTSVDQLVSRAVDEFGRLDGVVNCAGKPSPITLDELTDDEWDLTFAVNTKSVFLTTRRAAAEIAKVGGGSIVTIGSAAALVILTGQPAYCASKGAVITLTKALAGELADRRIRVNCICPGIVRTPMLMRYFEERYPDQSERQAVYDTLEQPEALGRMAEPREIAAAAMFLISDDASYVNGAVVSVDGGLVAVK